MQWSFFENRSLCILSLCFHSNNCPRATGSVRALSHCRADTARVRTVLYGYCLFILNLLYFKHGTYDLSRNDNNLAVTTLLFSLPVTCCKFLIYWVGVNTKFRLHTCTWVYKIYNMTTYVGVQNLQHDNWVGVQNLQHDVVMILGKMLNYQFNIKFDSRIIFSINILTVYLKSLSRIHFVKIRQSNFLGNEFLVKMYKLLRNYTFKIATISKIMYISNQ